MKTKLSRLMVPLLLAGCAATPPQAQPTTPAATPAPAAAPDCASAQPWTRASQALGRPVVQGTGVEGKPTYSIKGVSYADILKDQELLNGVKLTDPQGREPAPATVYNIVWTPDDATASGATSGCNVRYSAPTFFDVR